MIKFKNLIVETFVSQELRNMYFQITGADEEREYFRAYKRIIPYLKQAVEGGQLEHLRPKNGMILYRGYNDKQKRNTAKSYSKNLAAGKMERSIKLL